MFVGHSTVVIEVDGVRVLTDPLLRRQVAHLRRESRVEPESLGAIDAVLVSHAHRDHLDLPSLAALAAETLLVVPAGLGKLLGRHGHANVTEVTCGDTLTIGGVEIQALPAVHDGRRAPVLASRAARRSAMRFSGSRRVYFAGDTELFDDMDGLVADLDLALIPIWGWGPSLGRGEHLDPATAARAIAPAPPTHRDPDSLGDVRAASAHHARHAGASSTSPPVAFAEGGRASRSGDRGARSPPG